MGRRLWNTHQLAKLFSFNWVRNVSMEEFMGKWLWNTHQFTNLFSSYTYYTLTWFSNESQGLAVLLLRTIKYTDFISWPSTLVIHCISWRRNHSQFNLLWPTSLHRTALNKSFYFTLVTFKAYKDLLPLSMDLIYVIDLSYSSYTYL